MSKLIGWALVGLALSQLGGCAFQSHEVKVLNSKTDINVRRFVLEDGDSVLCDPTGCRVMKP